MNYNITLSTAPTMPRLGNGTELLKLLLTQVSKDMRQPLVPMIFPVLGAHMSGAEFQYPDLTFKEPCGMMANLVAESGGNKGQLSNLVEALCRKFRTHDETELQNSSSGRNRSSLSRPTRKNPSDPKWHSGFHPPMSPTPPSSKTPWHARTSADELSISTCPRWRWLTASAEDINKSHR